MKKIDQQLTLIKYFSDFEFADPYVLNPPIAPTTEYDEDDN
jgi:hypothetical protein